MFVSLGSFGLVMSYSWLVSNPDPLSWLNSLLPLLLPRTSLATKTPITAWRTCWPPYPEWSLFHLCLEAASLRRTWPQWGRWVEDLAAATRTILAAMAPWGNRPPQGQAPLGLAHLSLQDKVKQCFPKVAETEWNCNLLSKCEQETAWDWWTLKE